MGKLSARELGFDACMFMLHKTFGAPKGGRRTGRRRLWLHGGACALSARADRGRKRAIATVSTTTGPKSCGKIREFWGNVPQVVKAYAWARAMGADGIRSSPPTSRCVANNYMDARLAEIEALEMSNPGVARTGWR